MNKTILFIIIVLLLNLNCKNNPVEVKQENREPVILSVTVFPEIVKPKDSLIVICNAYDPDGDTLVYDWITTGIVRIKGAFGDDFSLYNTYENSRIFYATDSLHVIAPKDTFWVQCFARDRKGKSIAKIIHFTVIKDF
jgi:hypothetical protein